jgi:ArsR family transcriptional regulator
MEAQAGVRTLRNVLCEPARLRIVQALTTEPLSVGDLAASIDRKLPATSQHLKVLRELDLVESERRGSQVYYRIRPGPRADEVQALLETVGAADATRS